MPNENTEEAKKATDKAVVEKKATDKAELDRLAKEPTPAEPSTKNFTRDSIEQQLIGKFVNEGKTDEEAATLARKRALQMIPD